MRVPRTTVIRRLDLLQSWGLIDRRGCHYYLHEKTHSVVKNSLVLLSLFAGSTLSAAMRMGHNDRAVEGYSAITYRFKPATYTAHEVGQMTDHTTPLAKLMAHVLCPEHCSKRTYV
jgi:hypothetical protein